MYGGGERTARIVLVVEAVLASTLQSVINFTMKQCGNAVFSLLLIHCCTAAHRTFRLMPCTDACMDAADEVNALVLDVGSLYVKGGYAGEDTPKALFPSVRGSLSRCPCRCH